MFCRVLLVVGDEFGEGDRLVVVYLDRRVQDAVVRLKVWPVVGVRVAVYLSMHHIRPHAVVEGLHRVVAQREGVFAIARLQHRMDAFKVAQEFHLLFKRRERSLAEPYDVEMPEMLV